MLRISADARVVYANAAARQRLGVPGPGSAAPAELAAAARQAGVRGERLAREIAVDGAVFSAIFVAVGDEVNVYAQEITHRKRAEDALRRTNEELRAAHARLEETDHRKNEFLAVLSHELRNPLAPIRNGMLLLERAPPGSDAARRATSILRRQADHLTRLVDDLLSAGAGERSRCSSSTTTRTARRRSRTCSSWTGTPW